MTGGFVGGDIYSGISDRDRELTFSIVNLKGGQVEGDLFAMDGGTLNIFGRDFNHTLGPIDGGEGLLTGVLSDGTPISSNFLIHGEGSAIVLIPEPSTFALLLIGLVSVTCCRRQLVARTALVVAVLFLVVLSPSTVFAQYSFGDWVHDQGYNQGDVMPESVRTPYSSRIDSLDGISEFNWTATPTTQLSLVGTQISIVGANAFSELTNMKELYLWGNQISEIEENTFSRMPNLTSLHLNGNQISSIEAGDFNGLSNLTSLRLGGNQISSIEAGDFNGLSNLTSLRLDGNPIKSIEPSDFSGLENLVSLNLGGTQLSSIEADDFIGLTNLTELILGWNQLSTIKNGNFGELKSLKELNLRSNQISNIEAGVFNEITNLTWLDLGKNRLSNIAPGIFSPLKNLKDLSLGFDESQSRLNLAEANLSSLELFNIDGGEGMTSVSLNGIVVNQISLAALLDGGNARATGIGQLDGITQLDLSGIDFSDVTDLAPLYVMDDLTDLWLADTQNIDATSLDFLLDNLETIEGTDTEGTLYMTQADFDAFNADGNGLLAIWDAEPGHHVEFVPEPSTFVLLLVGLIGVTCCRRHV